MWQHVATSCHNDVVHAIITTSQIFDANNLKNRHCNRNFTPKIKNLAENRDFRKNALLINKNKILRENWNFARKLKFCEKIEILRENWNFARKLNLDKIEILIKKSKFWQKLEFWANLRVLTKIPIFG